MKNVLKIYLIFLKAHSTNENFKNNEKLGVIDPSELLRPEPSFAKKPVGQFRDYTIDETDPIKERVRRTYYDMHTNQTVDFVKGNNFTLLFHKKFKRFKLSGNFQQN